MKIAIGSDRTGFKYKEKLIAHMKTKGYEVIDVGTYEEVPCDNPYFASKVGRLIKSGECDFGVLICATGEGMMISANKIDGIMCGIGYCDEAARLMRNHNNCNVIAFGQEHMRYEDVEKRFEIFVNTPFGGMAHQQNRINQIKALERGEEVVLQPILDPKWNQNQ